ncbi:protein translocase subunit SecF [Patescibacteria group bacterium]|nr:protein translocase subunit SecF [Patescibacteria group bacterium]
MNYNIINSRKIWFTISGSLMALSIISLLFWGLKLGIDFTGGSLLEVSYQTARPSIEEVTQTLSAVELQSLKVQPAGDNDFLIRFENVSEVKHQEVLDQLKNQVEGQLEERKFESIGPTIGMELRNKAVTAIVVVLIFILAYIAYVFRKVSRPVASWKYGMAAIVALFHDILIVTGIFSALGFFFGVEIDTLFVTALLTILGFSVHDTIVTFDRVRENLFKVHNQSFEEIVNISVNQTITRSINTSLTSILTLLAVYIFGGESVRDFVLALILGFIVGTYSSIFIASPLLVWWNKSK